MHRPDPENSAIRNHHHFFSMTHLGAPCKPVSLLGVSAFFVRDSVLGVDYVRSPSLPLR